MPFPKQDKNKPAAVTRLHDLTRVCDLCGQEANSEVAEVVSLDCSYAQCASQTETELYHQACLEKYLKSIRCERNRKIGFPCPRGCGKATKWPEPCKGKIQKSHPVSIRSEGNKKRRQAELEHLSRTITADKAADPKGKGAKVEDSKATGNPKGKKSAVAEPAAKVKALNIATTSFTSVEPPKTAAQREKEALAAERDRIRAQLGARTGSATLAKPAAPATALAKPVKEKQVKTLDEYLAERTASSTSGISSLDRAGSTASSAAVQPPAVNAWARARAGSDASATEFPPPQSRPSAASPARGPGPAAVPAHQPLSAAAAQGQHPQGAWAAKQLPLGPGQPPSAVPHSDGSSARASLDEAAAADPLRPVPGMVLSPERPAAPLTKAQRKNLKRAEKKAAAGGKGDPFPSDLHASAADDTPMFAPLHAGDGHAAAVLASTGSVADSGDLALGDSVSELGGSHAGVGDIYDQCMQVVVQHRLQSQVAQLESLGFDGVAAVAAVHVAGGNFPAAVEVLLQPGGPEAAGWGRQGVPDVDVTEEVGRLWQLRSRHGLAAGVVEAVVVDCGGDLDAAAAMLEEQCGQPAHVCPPPPQPAPAAQPQGFFGAHHPPAQAQHPLPPHPHQPHQHHSAASGMWGGSSVGGNAPASSAASGGMFSAFSLAGLTEAALKAVNGASVGTGSIFHTSLDGTASQHSAGTPLHRPDAGGHLGPSLWGDHPPASGTTGASTPDAGLLAMLGVSDTTSGPNSFSGLAPPGGAAFADNGNFTGLYNYGSVEPQHQHQHQPMQQHRVQQGNSAMLGNSLFAAQSPHPEQQWGGHQASGANGLWGVQDRGQDAAAGPSLFGAPLPMQQPQPSQSQELNDLMATLMCR